MVSVFCGLNETNQFVEFYLGPYLECLPVVCGLSIIKYKLVSSANNLIVDCMSITMSFIKTIKNSGCRIDQWGTPALMKPQSDDTLLITTLCFLPDRYFEPNPKETLLYQLTLISLVNPDAKPYQMPY